MWYPTGQLHLKQRSLILNLMHIILSILSFSAIIIALQKLEISWIVKQNTDIPLKIPSLSFILPQQNMSDYFKEDWWWSWVLTFMSNSQASINVPNYQFKRIMQYISTKNYTWILVILLINNWYQGSFTSNKTIPEAWKVGLYWVSFLD